jgi:Reverse transcriptase (RNA-dependent DNA polymerase).
MQRKSTTSNLAVFTQYVSEVLDNRGQVDVVYTDFQKAFDQIDHNILLVKLESFGFSEALIKLFTSYLSDRYFMVRYQNFTSESFSPTSGVPQGSNLGPILFLFLLTIFQMLSLVNICYLRTILNYILKSNLLQIIFAFKNVSIK